MNDLALDERLEIRSTPKGRSVFARETLAAGELICSTFPYAVVVKWSHRHDVCHYCFSLFDSATRNEGSELSECEKCVARYCDDACRSKHASFHAAIECDIFQQVPHQWQNICELGGEGVLERAILSAICLQRSRQSPEIPFGASDATFEDVLAMARCDASHKSVVEAILTAVRFLSKKPDDNDNDNDEATVRALIQVETSNVFSLLRESVLPIFSDGEVAEEWGEESIDDEPICAVGSLLLVRGGYFNHSCNANVAKITTNRGWGITELYTVKEIEAGEELCITYLSDLRQSKDERTALLRKYYGFECACLRCTGDTPLTTLVCDSCNSLMLSPQECSICGPE